MNKNTLFVAGLFGFLLAVVSVEAKEFSSFIAKTYIDGHAVESEQIIPLAASGLLAKLAPQFKETFLPVPKEREVYSAAFALVGSLFENSFSDQYVQQLSKTTVQKMELLSGGEQAESDYMSQVFSQVKTYTGKAWAAHRLTHPVSDIQTLQMRQAAISFFVNNEVALKKCVSVFDALSGEKELLFFRSDEGLPLLVEQSLYLPKILNNTLNKSELLFELLRIKDVLITGALPCSIAAYVAYASWRWSVAANPEILQAIKQLPVYMARVMRELGREISVAPANTKAYLAYVATVLSIAETGMVLGVKLRSFMIRHLQTILIKIAHYMDGVRVLGALVRNNPELLASSPALQYLVDLDNTTKHSADFNYVVSALKTNTFHGEASYFSQVGRVLKVYDTLPNVIGEFEPILAAVGELDCCVALAHTFVESSSNINKYCFAEFVDYGPSLKARSFWNPFVLYHKDFVVPNDFVLGDGNGQNMIITGPNTGGKSTILKGLFLNVLLAQTFGIAAADEFILSPFHRLNCYLNITDDIAAGVSLFKAEVIRAKELLSAIQELADGQYSFTIMDEVFSGTSPKEGEEAAYYYGELLATFKNSACVVATHYPKLIGLPGYTNMHVEVIRNDDNSLVFTYKLQDGPSTMNIAMDILAEYGIGHRV